jgi:methionine--tRNA ligase beta chain
MEQAKFSDWEKIELRVGKIKTIEDIEGADKLYKIEVDLGKEIGKRTICAGLKQFYKKEDLKNKSIIVFVNLEPRVMRGIKSEGMLLAASSQDHSKVILLAPKKEVKEGIKIEFKNG